VNYIDSIDQLPPHFNLELRQFFEEYKKLEDKTVLVEAFQPAELAKEIIGAAIGNYEKAFPAAPLFAIRKLIDKLNLNGGKHRVFKDIRPADDL
jgi:hypothetical protein